MVSTKPLLGSKLVWWSPDRAWSLKGRRMIYAKLIVRLLFVRMQDMQHGLVCGVRRMGGPKVFSMSSMPFGATASVGAFLRLSVAIKTLGIMMYNLVWTSYYDDFIVVCRDTDCDITDRMVRNFFSLLGWELSHDEAKDKGFDSVFGALGVEFDLRQTCVGKLFVGNTENRNMELSKQIATILTNDFITVEKRLLSVPGCCSLRARSLAAWRSKL